MAIKKRTSKKRVVKKPAKRCNRHSWAYYGGEAKCKKCGKYLQPNGKVTLRP